MMIAIVMAAIAMMIAHLRHLDPQTLTQPAGTKAETSSPITTAAADRDGDQTEN